MNREPIPVIAATPPLSRWWPGAAWAGLALVWFASLAWRTLISPDEGRYASIALGMLQSGDWLTPRLNGLLYFEKPVLPYWIGAASLQLFGINEFAARFWPGLSGFLTIVVTAATARRLWGAEAGRYAGLVAAGTTWIIANSHFLSLDMGLTFFLTVTLCSFLLAQQESASPSQRRHAMWLCWAAMAGATLSKGLVGLLIPAATLLLYSLVQRQFGYWRHLQWLAGLAIYFALAAPWLVAVSLKNPGFFEFFFVREHFRRFLTDEARRGGAIYYFLPILFIGSLPWTTLALAGARSALRGEPNAKFQPLRLLLIWAGFVFLFFSVSRSKLPSYILPMFPALALLVAHQLTQVDALRLRRHLLLPAAVWLALLAATPLVARFASADTPLAVLRPVAQAFAVGALLFLLCAAAAWRWLGQARKLAAVAALAAGSLLAVTAGMFGYEDYGRQLKSSAAMVARLAPYLGAGGEVFAVRYYDQTLPFYLRRPVTLVDYRDEFSFGQDAEPGRWLPTLDAFAARWQTLPRAAAVMSMDTYRLLEQRRLPMRIAYQDQRRVAVVRPEAGTP